MEETTNVEEGWQTLAELRASCGVAGKRLLDAWREGSSIDGCRIESEEFGGRRLWRLVEADGHTLEIDGPSTDGEEQSGAHDAGRGNQEEQGVEDPAGLPSGGPQCQSTPGPPRSEEDVDSDDTHAVEDCPAHGRTRNGLADNGLLYARDVVDFVDGCHDVDEAVRRLADLDGVGQKGAKDTVGWIMDVAGWQPSRDGGAQQREEETPDKSPRSDAAESEPSLLGSEESGPTSSDSSPADGEGPDSITFGELDVGDEFPYRAKSGTYHFEKLEHGRREDGTPYNAVWLDGPSTGKRAFFTDDIKIFFDEVEEQASETSSEGRRPLHDRFNAWLTDRYEPITTSRGLDVYSDDDIMEVRRLLGGSYTLEVLNRFRRGEQMASQLRMAVERLLAGDVDEDEIDFTFDDVYGPGEPALIRTQREDGSYGGGTVYDYDPDDRSENRTPCKCFEPKVPEGEAGWVACQGRCGGWVWVEPIDDETAPAPNSSIVWPDEEEPEEDVPDEEWRPLPDTQTGGHPALRDCVVFGQADVDSEFWHALRGRGIGSSDAGAILGLSPHATPQDVWRSKTGEPQRARPWLDVYSEFGRWFEPHLLRHCERISGASIEPGHRFGTLKSKRWPRALCNLDGLDLTTQVIEELKTTSEKWTTIPEMYVAQVQHQMMVTGCHEARIRQYICPMSRGLAMSLVETLRVQLGNRDLRTDTIASQWLLDEGELVTWIVEFDDVYISRLIEREKEFWGYVERMEEPPDVAPDGTVDLTDDPDVYAAVAEYVRLAEICEIYKPDEKAAKRAKKEARRAIERAVALLEDEPKRIVVGEHKATLVVRDTHQYWNLYTGEADDSIIF